MTTVVRLTPRRFDYQIPQDMDSRDQTSMTVLPRSVILTSPSGTSHGTPRSWPL
ncbi:hypothetical protein JK361_06550 [Streptomyces sp. 5-8]|uniref:Uncharacterized protein n=1 Tax=Streptomyces musisoli TaxID=2802280 RepID=A0ABS1NVZ6_9ACTN|nr:hypothetical protein [Streptomyces musisoli]MBL1104268.1 hypothetical protein [Streptomyces musisoli]